MLLDAASIHAMTEDDLELVKAAARGHEDDRRDAQRTLQRGLDNGALKLGRRLAILLTRVVEPEEPHEPMGPSNGSESEKKMLNVRTLLTHEPRLGDNPSLTRQPSIESIVLEHYDRLVGEGQGAILADLYLEKIREAATASTTMGQEAPAKSKTEEDDQTIDGRISREHVANMVRMAVIAQKRPQSHIEIAAMINHGVVSGTIFEKAPELRRPYAKGGLIGTSDETLTFVSDMIREKMLTEYADGYLAKSTEGEDVRKEAAPSAAHPASDPVKPTESAEAEKSDGQKTAEKAKTPPPFSLGTLLSEIGVDLKVGNMDIISGVEKASRTGNAAPLMAGLAGVLLSAVANADSKKTD